MAKEKPEEKPETKEQLAAKIKKELEAMKKKAEPFKKELLAKFKQDIIGISILPPREKGKPPEVLVLLQAKDGMKEKFERKAKLEKEIEKMGKLKLEGIPINCILLDEVWEACYKGKYDILNIITIGMPLYDSGWLSALKATELHKLQILKKFEKYVVCYVMGGSMVRGEATKDSDIDTYVVIDDTDVSRMTRREIKERLSSIIWGAAQEACMAAGIKNKLNIQVYVLTDMWDSIKSANPVIFTFLRDGVPLYDRGIFMPWKLLLKMGKITPTPEAVDMYIKSGTQLLDRTKEKIKEIAVEDFFWSTLTPSQGALMLIGVPPPAPSETAELMRQHFVKPGLLEESYVKILEDNIKLRKDIEYGKIKEVDAKIVAERVRLSEQYLKRLDRLFKQIEQKKVREEVKELYQKCMEDVLAVLTMVGIQATEENALEVFKRELVDKQLAPTRYFKLLTRAQDIHESLKTSREELASLTFEQEKLAADVFDLVRAEKGKKIEKYKINCKYGKDKTAGIWLLTDKAYIIADTARADTPIWLFDIDKDGELCNKKAASLADIDAALKKFAGTSTPITRATIESLKKILGAKIELIIG